MRIQKLKPRLQSFQLKTVNRKHGLCAYTPTASKTFEPSINCAVVITMNFADLPEQSVELQTHELALTDPGPLMDSNLGNHGALRVLRLNAIK